MSRKFNKLGNQINGDLDLGNSDSEIVYEHFIKCLARESPDEILTRFRKLFILGSEYENREIKLIIEDLVNIYYIPEKFYFFLSQCCYIIINSWRQNPNFLVKAPLLITELESALEFPETACKNRPTLRQLVRKFIYTENFIKLKRFTNFLLQIRKEKKYPRGINYNYIANLIRRYPYLHRHYLLTKDSSYEFRKEIKKLQKEHQKEYELNLTNYATYRLRLLNLSTESMHIKEVDNPILLPEFSLDRVFKEYLGKIENNLTYKELAQKFIQNSEANCSYSQFKLKLSHYLLSGLSNKKDSQKILKNKINDYLQTIFANLNKQQVDRQLQDRTCCELLKFLVIDNKSNSKPYLYVELVDEFGSTKTVGLLLKLALLSKTVKNYLEQRFTILFVLYEDCLPERLPWLIKSLENLQLAFLCNFGKADLSIVKMMLE